VPGWQGERRRMHRAEREFWICWDERVWCGGIHGVCDARAEPRGGSVWSFWLLRRLLRASAEHVFGFIPD
jgi:hypothetical protein